MSRTFRIVAGCLVFVTIIVLGLEIGLRSFPGELIPLSYLKRFHKDVRLEIVNDTLTIQGEKKQENEEKGKNYYRMERSYGSFQRMLSLPEDADQNDVTATFKKGVLTVTMPRKALPKADVKQIEVKSA